VGIEERAVRLGCKEGVVNRRGHAIIGIGLAADERHHQRLVLRLMPDAKNGGGVHSSHVPSTLGGPLSFHQEKTRRKAPRFLANAFAGQDSTLYFLNHAIIWFQASSAASLR
jgi:hypothetical protein